MYRDTKEELQRLEQQLLEIEEEPEEPFEREQDFPEANLEPTRVLPDEDELEFYRKLTADYDEKIYNADRVDTDPEELGRRIREPEKENLSGLIALAFILFCAILLVLGIFFLRVRGYL